MKNERRSKEVRDAAVAEYVRGDKVADIAERHGVTRSCVCTWARKAGVPYRRVQRPWP